MSAIQIILLILFVIGVVIFILLLWAGCVFLWGAIEKWMLKRRIPLKLKQEVENARIRKQKLREVGTGEPEINRDAGNLQDKGDYIEPDSYEQLGEGKYRSSLQHRAEEQRGDTETKEWNQSDNRFPKRRKLERI